MKFLLAFTLLVLLAGVQSKDFDGRFGIRPTRINGTRYYMLWMSARDDSVDEPTSDPPNADRPSSDPPSSDPPSSDPPTSDPPTTHQHIPSTEPPAHPSTEEFKPTASPPKEFKCPRTGLYPDPTSCSHFIQCIGRTRQIRQECPNDMHFNPEISVCDWPENAKCVGSA